MNAIARKGYAADCDIGLQRWNRIIRRSGIDFVLKLPSPRFRRNIGVWAGFHFDLDSEPLTADRWDQGREEWIPSDADRAHIKNLMRRVVEPGKMASWLAPPDRGINNLGVDYEYVDLAD